MAKPKALKSYPSQLMQIALRAFRDPSFFESESGLTIPFSTAQTAQSFRTTFYEFRRALRLELQKTRPDPDASYQTTLQQALEGAEKLIIPRVNYDAEPPVFIHIKYNDRHGAFGEAYSFLESLFQENKSDKSEDPDQPLSREITKSGKVYTIPVQDIPEDARTMNGTKLLALVSVGSVRLKQPLESYFTGYIDDSI